VDGDWADIGDGQIRQHAPDHQPSCLLQPCVAVMAAALIQFGAHQVPRLGRGRPRTRPDRVLADKAYGSRANRACLRRRKIACTIPEKTDQVRNRKKRGSAGGRPPAFDPVNPLHFRGQ
jgi:hypothetical protein